ncbi:MAG: hypothetical protein P8X74_06690 [Reinekea sp.]|jgi:hypothetical protein
MDRSNWPPYNNNYYNYYSQVQQEDGQHTVQPEAGQTSQGVSASGTSGSYPAPGLSPNMPAPIPASPGEDLEYLLRTPQPTTLEEIIQNDALPESSNPQPAVTPHQTRASTKERFLAGLEAFERGAPLKGCSPSLRFDNYINNNGKMIDRGISLYKKLTPAEKMRLDQAIIRRQGAMLNKLAETETVAERFLAGLDNYARGAKLVDCSATLGFRFYVSDSGHLVKEGIKLCAGLSQEDRDRVNQALASRKRAYSERSTAAKRFLADLDNYAQGLPLANCSATLTFKSYITDDGHLHKVGRELYDGLSSEDQERVNRAILSRCQIICDRLADKDTVAERFLAGLDNYAQGLPLKDCSATLSFGYHVTNSGYLQHRGKLIYEGLGSEDKKRIDQALTARGRRFTQGAAKDVATFMAALKPYASGLTLQACGKQSGLKSKANTYLTPEGGLTFKGKRLIENLQPDQCNEVWDAIAKRQRHTELNPQVPEPSWQWPEMLPPMAEMGGMNPTAVADSVQTEAMQTDAMWATTWQLTGQAVPGPSTSAEPPISYYGRDADEADF